MMSMDTKQEITRRYFREGDSERKIARDLRINRKTVKGYLVDHLKALQRAEDKDNQEILQDFVASPPTYDSSGRHKRKLNEEIKKLILEQVDENERKKREGLRKQIKRKIDIHQHVLSKGYHIGYTTVCNFIRNEAIAAREAFIRQDHLPGEECEFDWGEVRLIIGGEQKRVYLAAFTAACSNYRYGDLYSRQDTLAFMESHNDFIAHTGGVYHEMVYDNMRVAVAEFVGRHEKEPTQALTNMAGWYQFRWRFCNVRRGNEKGHVERTIEVVRRKAFSDKDTFDTLEDARKHLASTFEKINNLPCPQTGKSPRQKLEEERPHLWKYPGTMECYQAEYLKVDKYATFSYGTNHYSVPDYLVGRMVEVKVYANQLKAYYNNLPVCRQERQYCKYGWQIDIEHYLRTLTRKPGALHGSVALRQAPSEIKRVYEQFFRNQPQGFIEILLYCHNKNVSHQKLIKTVNELSHLCPKDISVDKVIAMLGNQPSEADPPATVKKPDEIEGFCLIQLTDIAQLSNSTN
jgi:transposase